MKSVADLAAEAWRGLGLASDALPALDLTGADPALPSSFRVGALAQASLALVGAGAAAVHRMRGGPAQRVAVDMDHAVAEFRSERLLHCDGAPPGDLWDPLAGAYRTADGWLRVHTNFPHHRDALTALLDCAPEREAVAAALATREAEAVERDAAGTGAVVAALRPFAAWDAHPQGCALAAEPLIALERIGDAPPERPPLGARPLSGLRVLDLTRVIAGPVAGRMLAAHGAEVLRVTGPHLPALPALDLDTGRGKRATQLDLDRPTDRAALERLAGGADIFLQSYRPGALAARGFGAEALAARRPGVIVADLAAYGFSGPWADRRGFDSLVQTATGFNAAEAAAAGDDAPRPLPAQALDHGAGALLAFGIQAALLRRARHGGSWRVRVSLARTGLWLRAMGRLDRGLAAADPDRAAAAPFLEASPSPFGRLYAVAHAARLSATPPAYVRPSVPLDHDGPDWETESDAKARA